LWDEKKKLLWLVRDRVGIKPLYYTFQKGALLFASEIKALLAHPDVKASLDERAFYNHLTFVTSPPPRTLFKDIQKLPAGHFMTVNASGETNLRRYWNPFKGVESLTSGMTEDIVPRVMEKLKESVRYRMVSDVKVGTFLSGGIDSSAITALSSELQPRPVETFTVGFSGPKSYTEFDHATRINEKFKTNTHQIFMKPDDFFNFLPQLIESQEEPIGDPVSVPIYFLSKLARENNVIVCLVGEGSDELFCGYPFWKNRLAYQSFANSAKGLHGFLRRPFGRLLTDLPFTGWKTQRRMDLLRRACSDEKIFWGGSEAFPETLKRKFLSNGLLKRLENPSSFETIKALHDDFLQDAPEGADELHWMSYIDLRLRLPEILLMRIDKMAMAASVEGRVPFLDHELIRLVMSLGVDVRFHGKELKHLLKIGLESLLPRETLHRPKQGFGVPVEYWFVNVQNELIDRHILDFMKRTDLFHVPTAERYLKEMGGQEKWFLLHLALWHEVWIEGRKGLI
jgi:asparagine synthase (glutamine-hydrolysing)